MDDLLKSHVKLMWHTIAIMHIACAMDDLLKSHVKLRLMQAHRPGQASPWRRGAAWRRGVAVWRRGVAAWSGVAV